MRNSSAPDSPPLIMLTACEVEPLADCVENSFVETTGGRSSMNPEISTPRLFLVRLPARADTPQLNSFGKAFAGNGHQAPEEGLKEQIVETGDDKLFHSLNFH